MRVQDLLRPLLEDFSLFAERVDKEFLSYIEREELYRGIEEAEEMETKEEEPLRKAYLKWIRKSFEFLSDGLHALITYLSVLAVVGGTISGIIAHEPIEDILHNVLAFEIHEYLGLSLTPLFLALGFVRFSMDKKPVFRNVFTVLLVLLVILLFYQGFLGGKIVYEHLIKL
jgi:hypothetical protein